MSRQSDQTPSAWKAGKLPYGTGLTLETAKKLLEAGEKEAEKQGVPMAIAIVDAGGNLLAFHRMDNTLLESINIATDKAFTAVLAKLPTSHWMKSFQGWGFTPPFIHERWITFPGGFPIIKNGEIIGGIGVSGGTIEDIYVAQAALKAGGFSLDDVTAAIVEIESVTGEP